MSSATRIGGCPSVARRPNGFRPVVQPLEDRRQPGSIFLGNPLGSLLSQGPLGSSAATAASDLALLDSRPAAPIPTHPVPSQDLGREHKPFELVAVGSAAPAVPREMPVTPVQAAPAAARDDVSTALASALAAGSRPTPSDGASVAPTPLRGGGGSDAPHRLGPDGEGTWVKLAPLPFKRQEISTAVLNGEIFVIAGYDEKGNSTSTVQVYNPLKDCWRFAADLPIVNNHNAAAVAAGTLYAFGGLSNRVFAYDPAKDAWSDVAPMKYQHGNTAAVAVIDDFIYVAGGTGPGMTQTEFERYDPYKDEWTVLAPMKVPRNHTGGGAIDGQFYVAAGRDSPQAPSALEVYDPKTDQWTRLPDMPTGRSGVGAGVVNGSLYVFGGEGDHLFDNVEAYSPKDGWRQLSPMQTPRHGLFASVIDNTIYLPGGAIQVGFGASDVNEAYVVK